MIGQRRGEDHHRLRGRGPQQRQVGPHDRKVAVAEVHACLAVTGGSIQDQVPAGVGHGERDSAAWCLTQHEGFIPTRRPVQASNC